MSGLAAVSPKQQFKSALGIPLVGGTLDVFLSGTTTRTNTWQDKALTSLNTNPITLDSRGECLLWLDPTITYKLVLKDVLGVTQWTVDNVSGPFVASNISFTQSGTGAVSRTSQDKMREVVSVLDFGAVGDGVTDDAAAINACAAYCKSTGKRMYVPGGFNYRARRSLDFTKADPNDQKPLIVQGDSHMASLITIDLLEAFPGIDCTNNKRGALIDIIVRTTTTSLDTCSVLLAENVATGVNLFTFERSNIYNQSPNAKAAVIGVCADQTMFRRCEVSASGASALSGFRLDGTNLYGVTSKFITFGIFGGDLTYTSSDTSQFLCAGGPGLDVAGYSVVSNVNGYAAALGNGSPNGMVRLESTGPRQLQPIFTGFRSEDQSATDTTCVFKIVDFVYGGRFEGAFTHKTNGAAFTGPGTMINCMVRGSATVNLFQSGGPMIDCEFDMHAGANSIGTLAAGAVAGSANLTFSGRVATPANIMASFGTVAGLRFGSVGLEAGGPGAMRRESMVSRLIFPRTDTPTNYRKAFSGTCEQMTLAAYTGGAGLQQVGTAIIPSSVLSWGAAGTTQQVFPFVDVEIRGDTIAGFGVGGQIALTLTQGATTATLAAVTAIPAGQSGFHAKLRIHVISGSGTLSGMTDIDTAPTASGARLSASKFVNLSSLGFSRDDATDMVVGLQVLNSASNPIAHAYTVVHG